MHLLQLGQQGDRKRSRVGQCRGHAVSRPAAERTFMTGERDLHALLQGMKPEMQDGVFVFCAVPDATDILAGIKPRLAFREREATTVVVRREEADILGLPHQFPSRLITLSIHSSLEAVGFLAAITARLAEAGISANVVSAFYHDHLFVPEHRADEALALLHDMAGRVGLP